MPQKQTTSEQRHAVVVLGMHRSGTSALAGVFARVGCDLPNMIMPANEFNPKGFYESMKTYGMNDAILSSAGSSWDDWRAFAPGWAETPLAEGFLERGARILRDEYGSSPLFVLKDPRICRLMPFWTRVFEMEEIQPIYVHTHRNPIEVAKSLQKREGWPLARGLLLWLRHELEAEVGSRGKRRCFTSYDQLLQDWKRTMTTVQSRTDFIFPGLFGSTGSGIEEFLSAGLRSSVETPEAVVHNPQVSTWVRRVFEVLQRWAEIGEQEVDYVELDGIRADFDRASPIFSALMQTMQIEALQQELEEIKQEHQQTQSALKQAQELCRQFQTELAQRGHEAETLSADLTKQQIDNVVLLENQAQVEKSTRMMRINLQQKFESELETVVTMQRRYADKCRTRLEDEIQKLQGALEEEQQRQTETEQYQLERIAALEHMNAAYVDSTSWRITAPLRRIVIALRRPS